MQFCPFGWGKDYFVMPPPLWVFSQIYSFSAVGTRISWSDFEVKRSKVEVTVRPISGHISTLLGVFSPLSVECMEILQRNITVTHYQIHTYDTDNIFKVMGSKVKVTNDIFKKAVFQERHIDWWLAIEDHLVYHCVSLTCLCLSGGVCSGGNQQGNVWAHVQMAGPASQPITRSYKTSRRVIYRNSWYCRIWNLSGNDSLIVFANC